MVAFAEWTDDERLHHEAFDAVLWATACPGAAQVLPEPGFASVARCLLDLEVSFFTTDETLERLLLATGARKAAVEQADYVFVSDGNPSALAAIERAKRGDPLYPDRSATIFLGAALESGARLALSGPGIDGSREVLVGGVPPPFWTRRNIACRYPIGWDVFLVDGNRILGIPRSSRLEVL